jgi:glycosyltransferase involved in cell wall biosynthesis
MAFSGHVSANNTGHKRDPLVSHQPRVCLLSSVHPALDNRIFYREAQSLHRAGYEVVVVAVHDRDEVKEGIQILGLPRWPRWKRPLLWPVALRRALSTRAALYHFHDPELLLIAPWLRLLTGKPTIYDVHEANADFIQAKRGIPPVIRYPAAWVMRWLEPLLARLQSGLVLADEAIAHTFRHVRRPQAILMNYPERSFVAKAIAATRVEAPRRPIVLHLGGHRRDRGTLLMLEAFQRVVQAVPEARLMLVGPFAPSSLEQQVRDDIVHRRLEHAVTITGRVPFAEVGRYLQEAAVGWVPLQAVPKYQKNIPTKLFEYMAYGLPIVSSDLLPVRPFVQDRQNGYLVPPADPAAHARAILDLLGRPEQAQAMGRTGQRLVSTQYNWDEMEKRLLTLYGKLLGAPAVPHTDVVD